MSIWVRISEALKALASGEPLSAIFERLRTPPERTVAFTIAVISLSAKMAKADGRVTPAEVRAFREVFHIPPEDEPAAARVFNLARQDVAGFDIYAARIGRMFADTPDVLDNLLEGLLHIAMADGTYHDAEDAFLRDVARAFAIDDAKFACLRARHVPGAQSDPYTVLGVTPEMSRDEIRAAWRALVRDTHPDRMTAQGLPEEAIKLATRRLTAINAAWEDIQATAKAS